MRLNNKVAIITGATSGIGRAAAELFAKEGAKVILFARRNELGKTILNNIKKIGGFEPREEAYVPPLTGKDEWSDTGQSHYRGRAGLSPFGNVFPALVMYKINKVLGHQSIGYLSDRYLDSDFIYEMGRGELDPKNPKYLQTIRGSGYVLWIE